MNITLARKVLDQITEHPEQHDQVVYANPHADCGTVACIAGWALILSGWHVNDWIGFTAPDGTAAKTEDEIRDTARALLDLSDDEFGNSDYGDLFVGDLSETEARLWLADIIADAEAKENADD